MRTDAKFDSCKQVGSERTGGREWETEKVGRQVQMLFQGRGEVLRGCGRVEKEREIEEAGEAWACVKG